MKKENQRREERVKYKNTITYEESLGNEGFATPVVVHTLNISARGIAFITNKEFKLNTKLKITAHVSDTENVFFMGSIVRIQLVNDEGREYYLVGTEIVDINEDNNQKLKSFIQSSNMFYILDTLDLDHVVDIHFMAGAPIMLKKMGQLKSVGKPLDQFTIKHLLINLLDDERYAKFMKQKDVNFILTYKEIRLRVNMHFQQGKIEAVCRLVKSKIPTLLELGLPPIAERLIKTNSSGLIIISGRTGSGKTTTLASMVSALSKIKSGVIISIEDPIEYIYDKGSCIIKQREVGDDTISFESALRNALRQNPDVLVIGETLDKDTLELLLTTAESGVLVLTTMHSSSLQQALDRMASFFPPETQKQILTRLSLVLKGLIVQNLFPRIMGEEGLVLATEVLVVNDVAKKIIREGDWKQIPDIVQRGRVQGMQTMKESIGELVNKGIIDMAYSVEYYQNSMVN